MTPVQMFTDLRARGVHFEVRGTTLEVAGPAEIVTDALLDQLRAVKPELLRLLAPPPGERLALRVVLDTGPFTLLGRPGEPLPDIEEYLHRRFGPERIVSIETYGTPAKAGREAPTGRAA